MRKWQSLLIIVMALSRVLSETIRVERHIYRNGDNDYLIDGRKVRLRDIHDLFMDTGLGRDSFSIISQGRVEAIFNAKPEERRAIFGRSRRGSQI